MKKITSLILCVMLVVTMIHGMAFAEDGVGAAVKQFVTLSTKTPAELQAIWNQDMASAADFLANRVKMGEEEATNYYLYLAKYDSQNRLVAYEAINSTENAPVTFKAGYLLEDTAPPNFVFDSGGLSITAKGDNELTIHHVTENNKYLKNGEGYGLYEVSVEQSGDWIGAFLVDVEVPNDEGGGNQEGEGNGPGPLYWAYAEGDLEQAEWRTDPLCLVMDGAVSDTANNKEIYLAFRNGEILIPLDSREGGPVSGNTDAFSITGNNKVWTVNPGSNMVSSYMQFGIPEGPTCQLTVLVGDGSGLTVQYENQLISSGTIRIPECNGVSLPIYYNGLPTNGVPAFGYSWDEGVTGAGVSPDNKKFEVYLSYNAEAEDTCEVTLFYGHFEDENKTFASATYNVEVVPGVRLKDGNTVIMPNGTISDGESGMKNLQVMFGSDTIEDGYSYGTSGNAVCKVKDNGNGLLTVKTLGQGDGKFTVTYNGVTSSFTWRGTHVAEGVTARNFILQCGDTVLKPGQKMTLEGSSTFAGGTILLNGTPITGYTLTDNSRPGEELCQVTVDQNTGTFSITTSHNKGYTDLKLTYGDYTAFFHLQVQSPEKYILQFNYAEQLQDESWRLGGYATIGIFEKNKESIYTKFIVTDEEMRRIDDNHFVDIDIEEDLVVLYRDPSTGYYKEVPQGYEPFQFSMVDGGNAGQIMKITYDRGEDKFGPAYILLHEGYRDDKYLGRDSDKTENTIFLWTRGMYAFWDNERLQEGNKRWHYNAKSSSYDGYAGKNKDCDVKYVAVDLKADVLDEGAVTDNGISMEIETDLGSVILDETVLSIVDETNTDVTLEVLNVEPGDEEYMHAGDALQNATGVIDLSLSHENGTISEFDGGEVTVTLNYELQDEEKMPSVYYVGEQGEEKMECTYDASNSQLTFETNHFSMFKVVETVAAGNGSQGGNTGGWYVPSVDPLSPVKSEAFQAVTGYVKTADYDTAEAKEIQDILEQARKDIAEAKSADEINAIEAEVKAEIDKIKTAEEKALIADVEDTRFKARSKMTVLKGKTAIRVTWNVPTGLDFDGYDIFRSTKRNSGYGKKPFFTTKKTSYTNNKDLKEGTTYYYKVRAFKYVNDEKVYTQWSHKAWRTVK